MSRKENTPDVADLIADDFEKFEHFAVTYWRQIFYACAAIILLVALGAIGISVKNSMDNKALNTLAGAKTIEELEKALQKYPDNKTSSVSRLRLATMQIENKQYEKAGEIYRQLLIMNIPDEIRSRAQLNLAYILELQGKIEDAAASFEKIGENSLFSDAIRSEAKYSAARLFLAAKQDKKAKELLAAAKAVKPQSQASAFWIQQSQILFDQLACSSPAAPEAAAAITAPAAGK